MPAPTIMPASTIKRLPEASAKKRTWVYVQRPKHYEIAPCPCGNDDPDWSEYERHLWCAHCAQDFIPEHGGIFDGPIPVQGAALMGIDLRRFNLETQEIEDVCPGKPNCR